MINIPDEVKYLFQKDGPRKNILIHFPDGEHPDIINNQIVLNSVKLSESLCTRDTLQFGLCEASTFQAEVVGASNCKGAKIHVSIEIECTELGEDWCNEHASTASDVPYPFYSVSYGWFKVDSCKRQTSDMTHRRITATDILSSMEKLENGYDIVRKDYICTSNVSNSFNLFKWLYSVVGAESIGGNEIERTLGTTKIELHRYYTLEGYVSVVCEAKSYPVKSNEEKLYKLKAAKSNYKIDDCMGINEIFDRYVRVNRIGNEILNPFISFGIYIYVDDSSTTTLKVMPDTITSKYIYPHISSSASDASDGWIYAPYMIYVERKNRDGQVLSIDYVVKDIRDRNDIEIYEVTDGAWLDVTLSIPRHVTTNNSQYRPYMPASQTIPSIIYNSDEYPDMRQYVQGAIELIGQWGRYSRNGEFSTVTTKSLQGLYPDANIFPASDVFPEGVDAFSQFNTYESAWYDDELSKPFGAIYCEYTNLSNEKKTLIYYFDEFNSASDPSTYQVYSLKNNSILTSMKFSESAIMNVVINLSKQIKDVRYMPCEMKGVGLPYIEAGDSLSVQVPEGEFRTIILKRTLSGEQLLSDKIQSN